MRRESAMSGSREAHETESRPPVPELRGGEAGNGRGENVPESLAPRGQYSPSAGESPSPESQNAEPLSAEPLSVEQEQQLMEHLPTVRYLARRIHERLPHHVELDDLVSAGVVGLLDAMRKFDPAKKVQFRSYAQFRIRGAILDSLRMLDWSPRELRRKGRAVEEAIRSVTARLGRAPQESEIAMEMGLPLQEYQQLLGELKGLEIGTLHVERSEDSGEEELAFLPNDPEDDPLFRCLKGEMRERLMAAIDALPERERLVMTLYYYEEMTMKEIGLTLGVVESRVSQMHSSAVLHLRALLGGGGRKPVESGRSRTGTASRRASTRSGATLPAAHS
uniref:FliA/WhiG family RNA polymerase sigma factor n=1 Tax=Acidobacterium capsulatum TaxID=33075 RepID=A0A7V4XTI1_9BACT